MSTPLKLSRFERMLKAVAPQWALKRARSRLLARHFESATVGRRTAGWSRKMTDANAAASGATLGYLRAQARDLVRNNPWAKRGLRRIVANTVGWGIRPKATGRGADEVTARWREWGETTQCDAAGGHTFYGLERQVFATVVRDGECLVRRRPRRPTDGLAVPMQIQVLEVDYIDTGKDGVMGSEGGPIVQGIEFDGIGRRVAYWLFDQHPGAIGTIISPVSRRIPAFGILHVFDRERAGQVRGPSWLASVDVRLHDLDEFEDATLMKQKIAACMAAFVTDLDGAGAALGEEGTDVSGQLTDTFEPGMILNLPQGKQVTVANPPVATDHQSFLTASLRGVAAGMGCTYEDLTGDYSQVNFSSARMSRLAHQGDVHDWRENILISQFCAPVWSWMLDALLIAGVDVDESPARWVAPPPVLVDPDKEGLAYTRMIRAGLMTWQDAVRELGEDPDRQIEEIAETNKAWDAAGIQLDSDPRRMSQAGLTQVRAGAGGGGAPSDAGGGGGGAPSDAGDEDPPA